MLAPVNRLTSRFLPAFLLALLTAAAACGGSGTGGDGDGDSDDPGLGDGDLGGDADGPLAPGQPPPGVVETGGNPGAPENQDADGYCFDPEAGYYPCDDGAPPGTGVPGYEGDGDTGDGDSGDGDSGDGDSGDGDSGDGDSGDGDSGDGDGPGGDGDGPGGDGDGPGGEPVCTSEAFSSDAAENARVLLVVDKSGSMDEDAVGYAGSKWDGAVEAISAVVQSTDSEVDYGLMLYPDGTASSNVCREGAVEVSVGPASANDIISELNSTSPGGGTPTASSLQEAKAELDSLGDGAARAVVLATDGAPNCNLDLDADTCTCTVSGGGGCGDVRNCLDDDGAVAAAEALNAAGYSVFVIGIPGSENFSGVLNDLADAGGTALPGSTAFYQANDSATLGEAIADIVTRIATCRFDLSFTPAPGSIDVSIGGNEIPQDPTRQNGWDLVDADTVELFGASCSLALGGSVEVGLDYCYLFDG